jgi:MFS family permease
MADRTYYDKSAGGHVTTAAARPSVVKSIDDAKLSAFHFKAATTAGAGFFTDAYDLNVIGTVTLLATPEFHLNGGQISMLTSSTLLAVAIGAVAFGRLGDRFGRRRVHGLEAGVLPSLLVLYQRRHMPESPRWTAERGDEQQAMKDFEKFSRAGTQTFSAPETTSAQSGQTRLALSNRKVLITLLGTAGTWFFFNVAIYGSYVSQPLLIKSIAPHGSILSNIAVNAVLVVTFSLSGAIAGLLVLDRIPRRKLQTAGFALCALSMLLITRVPSLHATVVPFALVFGLSLFGVAFGPNYTTILLAAESYPTAIRSTFHGLSSGIAKIGAFAGALVVPLLLSGAGLRAVTFLGFCCYAAGIATTLLVREPSGQALDDISQDLNA